MSGGSGGGNQTSTTVQSIPAELKPLATAYTNKAINLGGQSYNPFQGQRYANLNPTQNLGIQSTINRAVGGSRTIDNAERALNENITGGPNPYLDSIVNQAQGSVVRNYQNNAIPQLLGSSMSSGSFGNSGVTAAARESGNDLQENLGDIATQIYGGAYETDKARQLQSIGQAQSFGNQAYTDAGQITNAGQILQDQAQRPLDFNFQQYQDREGLPYRQLAAMSGVFGSNLGSSSQTNTTGGGGGK